MSTNSILSGYTLEQIRDGDFAVDDAPAIAQALARELLPAEPGSAPDARSDLPLMEAANALRFRAAILEAGRPSYGGKEVAREDRERAARIEAAAPARSGGLDARKELERSSPPRLSDWIRACPWDTAEFWCRFRIEDEDGLVLGWRGRAHGVAYEYRRSISEVDFCDYRVSEAAILWRIIEESRKLMEAETERGGSHG